MANEPTTPPTERVPTVIAPRAGPVAFVAAGWRTHMREFAVIVAGVLCALAAQAWWEGREERRREQDYLQQLLGDTRENERRLDAAIADDSASREALVRLSTGLYSARPAPPSDTLVGWFTGSAFSSSDFKPLSGTYGAIIAAGDLRLIRTDTLRARIVAYAASLDHERAMLALYMQQAFGDADRFARALPFMKRMFSSEPDALLADFRASGLRFDQLRENRDLAGMLFALQAANSNRLGHLRRLRDETRDLLQVLEAESR